MMNPTPPFASSFRRAGTRALTLVEAMVATMVFALAAAGVTGVYLRNAKSTMDLRYRTTADSVALNILEQIRVLNYQNLQALHDTASVTTTIPVLVADPTAPYVAGVPMGYKQVNLVLNVLDGTVQAGTDWTKNITIPMETAASSAKLRMQFWLTLKANNSTTTPVVQTIELALIYQWNPPGNSATSWQTGTIHSVVPNPSPANSTGTSS